jgi:glutaredoxin 3|tara:strand:+ start:291 stop:530 length:240 start_codon:yes stop_codon:yes gene_type:complete
MNVEIYSKTNCIFCDKAKMRLQKHNPTIRMLDEDYSREDFFKKFPNARTFPQIIINEEHVGGYAELKRWLEQNSFDEEF